MEINYQDDMNYQDDINYQNEINYQEDIWKNQYPEYDLFSDIFPFQEQKSSSKKKSWVWDYFNIFREKKHGYVKCTVNTLYNELIVL
jgi:hypothetical protein